MKGMFLISREGPPEIRDLYAFEPYLYGPFNREVYSDLATLESEALITSQSIGGTSRRVFRTTSAGNDRIEELIAELPEGPVSKVQEIKKLVTSLSFLHLLRHVYARHPEYSVRSVLR